MTEPGVPYAGIATRAVALALDVLIVHVIVLAVAGVLALIASLVGGVHLGVVGELIAAAAWLLAVAFYFVLFWSTVGQTPGMRLMDLRVATRFGVHPGVVRSVVRIVGLGLAIVPLFAGFIPVLFDSRRRALQDFLAGTVVLYGAFEPPPAPEPAVVAVVGDVQPSG
jgi:uncharacterized RDD family membrane protein YckC